MLAGSALLLAIAAACDRQAGAEAVAASGASPPPAAETTGLDRGSPSPESDAAACLADAPLAAYRQALLELAFESASAMPLRPHVKNRSRAQEAVIEACLELDQPVRALDWIDGIENWRRGACYADVAFYGAQHGVTADVEKYVSLAAGAAENADGWRRDRIRSKIARAYAWLGRTQQADSFAAGLEGFESGKVDVVRAARADDDAFDEQAEALDRVIAAGSMDELKNALDAYARLFDRFYDDADRRSAVERKIKASWNKLPVTMQLELMMALVETALDHKDPGKAHELVDEAQAVLDGHQWDVEHGVPLAAELARLRCLAGDPDTARSQADATLALFEARESEIVDMFRAEALRPVAEAYQAMGDTAAALAVYKRVVDEGVANPFSRPRAMDLSATLVSMAVHGVEPDAELWSRVREISGGLGDPW